MVEVNFLAVLPKAILVDMDGCTAIINGRGPFDGANCATDLPNWPVIDIIRAMHAQGVGIIFVSGRNEAAREATEKWLHTHVMELPTFDPIPHKLFMRPDGDTRPDDVVKLDLHDRNIAGKYEVRFVLDDRRRVVRMWRDKLGLTCLQVNDGPKNEKDECVHCGGLGVSRSLVGDEKAASEALSDLCGMPSWVPNGQAADRAVKALIKAVAKGRAR